MQALEPTAEPRNAIAAVTHPNPYPYYARLVAEAPLAYDAQLGAWVAASAETVCVLLNEPRLRVRPTAEPVPKALRGSAAGVIFRQLVRMNDGTAHSARRKVVEARTTAFNPPVDAAAARWAQRLLDGGGALDATRLDAFAVDLPVHALGTMLRLDEALLPQLSERVGALARAFAPGADEDDVDRGVRAAGALSAAFSHYENDPLGIENAIGLLFQARETTAGLLLNTLLALAHRRALHAAVMARRIAVREVVSEVVRYDPPVQNTRRFADEEVALGGHVLRAGDAVVLALAAANRDPAFNPEPERFDPARTNRRTLTFGDGAHACPGEIIAIAIATAGVRALLDRRLDLEALTRTVTYRPSLNLRIPSFTA